MLFSEGDDLGVSLFDLAGRLGMDAVAAASLDTEVVSFSELVGPHQRVKIGVLAGLEKFSGFCDMFVLPAQAHQQVAPANERGAERRRRDRIVFRSFDQHAGVAGVHWQPKHLAADRG